VPSLSVELLWWEGCPSTESARALVRAGLDEIGCSDVDIQTVEIETDEQARQLGFKGSPTILIDKVDLTQLLDAAPEATDSEAQSALTCRLYRRRDGRISPTPDAADVREALTRAVQRRQNQRSEA
jgi:hypothetical protein